MGTGRPAFQYSSVLLGLLSLAALGVYISKTYIGLGPGGMERMIVWPVLAWGLAFGGHLFAPPSASGTSVTPLRRNTLTRLDLSAIEFSRKRVEGLVRRTLPGSPDRH